MTAFLDTAIVKLRLGDLKLHGFYLESNPLPQPPTKTTLTGLNLEHTLANQLTLGFAYIHLPFSQISTREGMNVYNFRFWWSPQNSSQGLWLTGEYAYETQSKFNVEANGLYLQIGYNFDKTLWKPSINYLFAYFSGDNPNTPNQYEQFDSLYYASNWDLSDNFSNFLSNSNQITHQFSLTLQPTNNLSLTMQYFLFFTPQPATLLNSPLSWGDLGSELDLTAQYQINSNISVSANTAFAFPGPAFGRSAGFGNLNTWSFFGLTFNWSF